MLSILDIKKWRAIYVHPITSQILAFVMGKSGVPNRRGTSSTAGGAKLEGVLLFQVSVWSELWEHAAAAGFKHFTKEYLDHAIVSENQCERLSTSLRKHHTLEKIFGLVEYALPDRDGSVYKRLLRERFPPPLVWPRVLTPLCPGASTIMCIPDCSCPGGR